MGGTCGADMGGERVLRRLRGTCRVEIGDGARTNMRARREG